MALVHTESLRQLVDEHYTKLVAQTPFAEYIRRVSSSMPVVEFPHPHDRLLQLFNGSKEQYFKELDNFILSGRQDGRYMPMPHYPVCGIEDNLSLVVFDHKKNNNFTVLTAMVDNADYTIISLGNVALLDTDYGASKHPMRVLPLYAAFGRNGTLERIDEKPMAHMLLAQDMVSAVMTAIEELMFLYKSDNN